MTLNIELKDYQLIRKGLLELKAKKILPLLSKLDSQVIEQQNKVKETKGE